MLFLNWKFFLDNKKVAQILISRGANANAKNYKGVCAIQHAVFFGTFNWIEFKLGILRHTKKGGAV